MRPTAIREACAASPPQIANYAMVTAVWAGRQVARRSSGCGVVCRLWLPVEPLEQGGELSAFVSSQGCQEAALLFVEDSHGRGLGGAAGVGGVDKECQRQRKISIRDLGPQSVSGD